MTAPSAKLYGLGLVSAFNQEVDLSTVKLMLCTASYTPNQDTHQYKSSVDNEVTGDGYTAGGAAVASAVAAYNGTTNVFSLDGDNVTWENATLTGANQPQYGVLYSDSGSAATSPLIGYIDFGTDDEYAPSNGTLTVQWNAAGIATITVA